MYSDVLFDYYLKRVNVSVVETPDLGEHMSVVVAEITTQGGNGLAAVKPLDRRLLKRQPEYETILKASCRLCAAEGAMLQHLGDPDLQPNEEGEDFEDGI